MRQQQSKVTGRLLDDGPWLAVVLVVAVLLRAVFFTGFVGLDEVTYLQSAHDVLTGAWRVSNYSGAIRYGVNIPMAAFMKLLGVSEFSASLWSSVCSLGEIIVVFLLARAMWGQRVAILAALVLALLPLHAHFAGRPTADAPLGFFITLSFALLWFAERKQFKAAYLGAGVAAGMVFWIKPPVFLLCVPVIGLYALLYRRWHPGWAWMGLGAVAMIGANCVLMWWITGDPLHILDAMRSAVVRRMKSETEQLSPTFYLRYLLLDVRHTWILGYLTLGGMLISHTRFRTDHPRHVSSGFVLVWALGLLAVFSVAVITLSPLKFVLKQTNYMLIFVAPMSLLAGFFLAQLKAVALGVCLLLLSAGGVVLSGLEQQSMQVLTSNSQATVLFARAHPQALIFAGVRAEQAETYHRLVGTGQPGAVRQILPLGSFAAVQASCAGRTTVATSTHDEAYVIVDNEAAEEGDRGATGWSAHAVPSCLERVGILDAVPLGHGRFVARALIVLGQWLPSPMDTEVTRGLTPLTQPEPAVVFRRKEQSK